VAGTLSKLPWYGQVGAFLALSAAGLAAFFYLYARPMQGEIAQRQRKLDALQADIRKGQAIERRLPQFRADVATLEARLDTLRNVLPEEKDMADLLRRLQTLAVRSNLTIRRFKPSPTMVTKELHAELPITLQLDGSYNNLGMFFDRVSKFPRIIHMGAVDIKAKDRQEPNSTITADCVATTFILLENKPPAAPAGQKTPGTPAGAKPPAKPPGRAAPAAAPGGVHS
jgi:type IV pilus assembly protein PilO